MVPLQKSFRFGRDELTAWLCGQLQKPVRWKNLNTAERVQDEEIVVAGNEVSCISTQRQFQEFVVFGVATDRNALVHVNPGGLTDQSCQKSANVGFVDISAEMSSIQNLVNFNKRRE